MSLADGDGQEPCLAKGCGVQSSACVRCSRKWTRRSATEQRHLQQSEQILVRQHVQVRRVGAAVGTKGTRKAGLSSCH